MEQDADGKLTLKSAGGSGAGVEPRRCSEGTGPQEPQEPQEPSSSAGLRSARSQLHNPVNHPAEVKLHPPKR